MLVSVAPAAPVVNPWEKSESDPTWADSIVNLTDVRHQRGGDRRCDRTGRGAFAHAVYRAHLKCVLRAVGYARYDLGGLVAQAGVCIWGKAGVVAHVIPACARRHGGARRIAVLRIS